MNAEAREDVFPHTCFRVWQGWHTVCNTWLTLKHIPTTVFAHKQLIKEWCRDTSWKRQQTNTEASRLWGSNYEPHRDRDDTLASSHNSVYSRCSFLPLPLPGQDAVQRENIGQGIGYLWSPELCSCCTGKKSTCFIDTTTGIDAQNSYA